ncbi:MAG: hypothetical protein C4527_26035 [Candidatus Omnitrophota bacterium]|nr:MAG: hypothetical protein C4527_26035 [Candidatus Omnitrophota bacterium]
MERNFPALSTKQQPDQSFGARTQLVFIAEMESFLVFPTAPVQNDRSNKNLTQNSSSQLDYTSPTSLHYHIFMSTNMID